MVRPVLALELIHIGLITVSKIKRFRIIVAESGPLKKLWKPPAVWKFIDFHFLLTGPICRTSLTSDPCPKCDLNVNPMGTQYDPNMTLM